MSVLERICLIGTVLFIIISWRSHLEAVDIDRVMEARFYDDIATLAHFDNDTDQALTLNEFTNFTKALFKNSDSWKPYNARENVVEEIFKALDLNSDGTISRHEWSTHLYPKWLRKLIEPVPVLIVVNVQNDFITGAVSLKKYSAKQDGADVIDPINQLIARVKFKTIIFTQEWHPSNHISFLENIHQRKIHKSSDIQDPNKVKQTDTIIFEDGAGSPLPPQAMWPQHCVQNSDGAKLSASLNKTGNSRVVQIGTNADKDDLSALLDHDKQQASSDVKKILEEVAATDVVICGLPVDYCVGETALDSLRLGYKTIFVEDASKGVDTKKIEKMRQRIAQGNGVIVKWYEVPLIVKGIDRRPELGLFLAKHLQKSRNVK